MKKALSLCLCIISLLLMCSCDILPESADIKQNNTETSVTQTLPTQPNAKPDEDNEITEEESVQITNLIETVSLMEKDGKEQQDIKSYLEELDWVENVSETADGGLTCITKYGVTGVWTPETANTIGNPGDSSQDPPVQAEAVIPRYSYDIDSIAILCPYASEDPSFLIDGYSYLGEAMDYYTDCTVEIFEDEEVSLELLKNLDRFDMVWFYSHGALSNVFNSAWAVIDSDPYTMTGEFADSPSAYVLLSDDFFFGRTVINLSDGRIGIGGNFYKHYYSDNQLDGMFFHFASCNSMRTDKLADGILSRGAAWVEGWDNSVTFANDYMQFTGVLTNLLRGNNIEQSVTAADQTAKADKNYYQEDCKLKGKGHEQYKLIIRDFYEPLLGTYKGSYFATQGETGLTLTVYKEDDQYKALFDFYNLPGKSNAKSGSYYMDVTYDIETDEYIFTSTEWITKPSTYDFVDLKGKLNGDVLSGESPTKFSVNKTNEATSFEVSLEDMPIVAHDSYKENEGDSTIFNLNGNGLTQCDDGSTYNRYGNIGIDGTVYSNGFEVWIARWNYTDEISWASATFDLGGQYKTLVGKTNLIKSYNTANFDTTICFYDGATLLASYRLTDEDYIKDISVDVSEVEHLTVEAKDNVAVSGGTSFALYDMFLYNDYRKDDISSSDIHESNGHRYQLFNSELSWDEAKKYCEDIGGHLVTITSAEEQAFIETLLTLPDAEKSYYWIGASDAQKEGMWSWVTDEPFDYANWKAKEPNNEHDKEHYLHIYRNTYNDIQAGQWNDVMMNGVDGDEKNDFYSENSVGFICEWE